MTLEIKIAEALERALSGKTICEKIGYWEVSAMRVGILRLYLTYRRGKKSFAHYIFEIEYSNHSIQFTNHHRKAVRGIGTFTLKQIEGALDVLSIDEDSVVTVVFPLYGQKDTERWLLKNDYLPKRKDGTYVKEFHPADKNHF